MEITFGIFLFGLILLVPVAYVSSFIPDACAAIRDPKFDIGKCSTSSDGKQQTCCWYQKSYPEQFGRGDKYCQTCTYYHDSKGEPYEKCTEPKKQAIQLPPGSNVPKDLPQLQLKSTDNSTSLSNDSNISVAPKELEENDRLGGFEIQDLLGNNDNKTN